VVVVELVIVEMVLQAVQAVVVQVDLLQLEGLQLEGKEMLVVVHQVAHQIILVAAEVGLVLLELLDQIVLHQAVMELHLLLAVLQ
jgi:hypothetical protein